MRRGAAGFVQQRSRYACAIEEGAAFRQPLLIDEALAEQIKATARAQNGSVDDFLRQLMENYATPQDLAAADAALDVMEGMFADSDVINMSTTVRQTMEAYYREK